MQRRRIGHTRSGIPIRAFELTSASGVRVVVAEYGASVLSIRSPDRAGRVREVFSALGGRCDPFELDAESKEFEALRGRGSVGSTHCALVGSSLDGPAHSVWWGEALADGVRFHYRSPAGEEGRACELDFGVEYRLDSIGVLRVEHSMAIAKPPDGADERTERVAADLATPLAFALGGSITHLPAERGHARTTRLEIQIESRELVECDASGTPTGHLMRPAQAASLHQRQPLVGTRAHPHTYVLKPVQDAPLRAATLWEVSTGRYVEVSTTRPTLALRVERHANESSVTLCPRDFPAADRHPHFPGAQLRAGETRRAKTSFRFGTET